MIIPGDTQPKRGDPIPKGLLSDVNVYIAWYNKLTTRSKCSECGAMVELIKTKDGHPCMELKHQSTCPDAPK